MLLQTGCFLQSHSTSPDDYFYDAVICLVEYNAEGALGFIVNRAFPRTLHELVEFRHLPSFPLWEGGPVDEEHLYFIHRRPDIIQDGEAVKPGLYYGGNFKQATEAIEQRRINDTDLRIFVGYCGWHTGELEQEMERNEWSVIERNLFS